MGKNQIQDWISTKVVVPKVTKLNRRMKRLVTIASLFGYFFSRIKHTNGLEERLSKIMNLCNNYNAITFPLVYNSLIWSTIEKSHKEIINVRSNLNIQLHKEYLTTEDIDNCANMMIGVLPSYLVYDNIEAIKQDFSHLIESLPFILGNEIVTH